VQVHYDEGVANHIGPEPCVVVRKGRGEASAGERIGQPLSRESYFIPSADAVDSAEGNTDVGAFASPKSGSAWSQTLACAEAPCAGTGRSCVRPMGIKPRKVRIGKVRSRSR
jgi:hypothetical protein